MKYFNPRIVDEFKDVWYERHDVCGAEIEVHIQVDQEEPFTAWIPDVNNLQDQQTLVRRAIYEHYAYEYEDDLLERADAICKAFDEATINFRN